MSDGSVIKGMGTFRRVPTHDFASSDVYNIVGTAEFINIIEPSHEDAGSVDSHSKLYSPPAEFQLRIVFLNLKISLT